MNWDLYYDHQKTHGQMLRVFDIDRDRTFNLLSHHLASARSVATGRPHDVSWLDQVTTAPDVVSDQPVGQLAPLLVDRTGQPINNVAAWQHHREHLPTVWQTFLGPMPRQRPPVRLEVLETQTPGTVTRQLVRAEGRNGNIGQRAEVSNHFPRLSGATFAAWSPITLPAPRP